MIKSAESTAKNTSKNSEKSEKNHPLKNKPFFAIPRHVAMIPGLTDRLFRLMSILCSAYGNDGHIEFKISTLATLLQKGERQTRDLIKEARAKGLVTTKETGRSLVFFLGDICFEDGPKEVRKPAQQVGGNPQVSYKDQKKELKEKTPPNPPLKFPNPPPEKLKPDPGLVDFKNRIKKETLANDFNGNTYQNLKKLELTDGQIKTLIDRMNLSDARTCGWLLLEAKKGDIEDYDIKLEKQRQELERQRQPIPQDNFEPISVEEMRKMTADRRNRQYQTQPTSEPVAPAKPQKSLAFEERRELFLSAVDPSLHEYYLAMSDYELQNRTEFQRHAC